MSVQRSIKLNFLLINNIKLYFTVPVEDSNILNMEKVILYYCFTPINDPEAIKLWQKSICDSLDIKGRIIISKHGINGTLGGSLEKLKKYINSTKKYESFRKIKFGWSESPGDIFPRMSIKVREEIVTFGAPNEIKVNKKGVINTGKRLNPENLHKFIRENDDVIFFDGRNAYESSVGYFKNAVLPKVNTTRDFIGELKSGKYDALKAKKIVTYCTGGVRCEILSALMKNHGFENVYQLDGGIMKYGKTFGNNGLWNGVSYVFDKRMIYKFGDDAKVLGICTNCENNTWNFENCFNKRCHKLIILCKKCCKEDGIYCSKKCKQNDAVKM